MSPTISSLVAVDSLHAWTVFLCVFISYICIFRVLCNPQLFDLDIPQYYICKDSVFPNKVTSTGSMDMWTHLFGTHHLTHHTVSTKQIFGFKTQRSVTDQIFWWFLWFQSLKLSRLTLCCSVDFTVGLPAQPFHVAYLRERSSWEAWNTFSEILNDIIYMVLKWTYIYFYNYLYII